MTASRPGGDASVKSVQRVATIIRLLAGEAAEGLRLSDVARESGLGKATTHRLLTALAEVGFAYQSAATKRYHVGHEIVRLGALAARHDLVELARPSLLRLARETGDTIFLSVREGLEAVCLDRQVGAFPIRTLTLDAGDRRPLGVGAGSLALLAFLPLEEIAEIVAGNEERLAGFPGFTPEDLHRLARETRARGHSFNDGRIVAGMCAIGAPVLDASGRVAAAISVAAISDRMGDDRAPMIARLIKEEAKRLGACFTRPASNV
ncbi:IclR family transcriptional regulator [Pikeienuella piscinae]|uniref:IclR family transcriptional regulator n=1 Tax=Pikeienuella piscinae TaxID=2748098 RepID=A0A7L5BWU3_9RHOB|nr:IclR family transcriptional regulator [Pikeienuella piscinae]QIE55623.1 IclR family transcriptional regulator [Pikeienuella piscinae]